MISDMKSKECVDVICSRRSIRRFTSETISSSDLKILLKAGMQAPSARNTQSWQFVVINQRENLIRIAEFHPYAGMLNHAPVAIAVCADLSLEPNLEYGALNCAAATENILLAAHAIGLGAVWLGIYPRKQRMTDLKDLLNLPDQIVPIALIALGHPEEKKDPEDRYRSDRIHYNQW